jgi:hypothetical protein
MNLWPATILYTSLSPSEMLKFAQNFKVILKYTDCPCWCVSPIVMNPLPKFQGQWKRLPGLSDGEEIDVQCLRTSSPCICFFLRAQRGRAYYSASCLISEGIGPISGKITEIHSNIFSNVNFTLNFSMSLQNNVTLSK